MEKQIFEVSEVNEYVKNLLDDAPLLRNIRIRGELSNYKMYPSGHHYFTMKDASGALRCVMFRGAASQLRFRPENGMKVVACGRIAVFPRDGTYQLTCNELSPDGVGDLYVAFEQLKAKLLAEGLFERSHKQPLPCYPEKIALVTSSAGAAVHDMIRILQKRYPLAKILLLPVRVQGIEAPAEIAGALRYVNRYALADVLITGRGGGSMEDLWAFNDERVARAIYDSKIPVISAVGHEPDVTIADFVADLRAATPSHAAELAVPEQGALLRKLQSLKIQLAQSVSSSIALQQKRLTALTEKRVLRDQLAFVQDKKMLLAHMQQRLADVAGQTLSRRRQHFAALAASLDAMSPLKVLGRGYAMVQREDGALVKSWQDAKKGEQLRVTLGDGMLACMVEEAIQKQEVSQ